MEEIPTRSSSSTWRGSITSRARPSAFRSPGWPPPRRRSSTPTTAPGPTHKNFVPTLRSRPMTSTRPVRMCRVTAPTTTDFAAAQQAREAAWLSEFAMPSYPARRERIESECGLRTPFQRDRDRIVHCKAFRRLKHKTQVFVAPEGDHYRTRLTHTLEVTGISRTVARALRLNE